MSVITTMVLSACGKAMSKDNGNSDGGNYNSVIGQPMSDKYGDYVTKELDLKDFTALNLSHIVTVNYTQAKKYSVRLTCRAKDVDKVKAEVDYGTLYLSVKEGKNIVGNNDDNLKIVFDICAPTIERVECSGASKFNAGAMSVSRMDLQGQGAAKVNIEQLKCKPCKIDCGGAAKLEIRRLSCGRCDVEGSDAGKILIENVDCDTYDTKLSGAASFFVDALIKADKLNLDCSGAAKADMKFKGGDAEIDGSGAAKIKLDVDCKSLKAEGTGAANITVTGTADHTDINSGGASDINVKGLNKY